MPIAPSPFARLCIVAFLAALAPCTSAGERMALLIGNNTYDVTRPADRSPNLRNAVADATAMEKLLVEQARFVPEDVTLVTNVDRTTLDATLTAFTQRAKDAGLVLLFYAGHGMESSNGKRNYLLPTGVVSPALSESDIALAEHGVNLEQLLWSFHKTAPAANKVAILDCCRERPSENSGVGVAGGGMAAYPSYGIPDRTAVLLAASPGRLPADGDKAWPLYSGAVDGASRAPAVLRSGVCRGQFPSSHLHEGEAGALAALQRECRHAWRQPIFNKGQLHSARTPAQCERALP